MPHRNFATLAPRLVASNIDDHDNTSKADILTRHQVAADRIANVDFIRQKTMARPCSLECVINGPWSCWAWLLLADGNRLQTTPRRQQPDKKRSRLPLLQTAQIDKLDGEPVNKNNHLPWCKQKNTMAIGGWTDFGDP
ncbi:uncharacterized protein CLUP02_03668 [Colletotrichum lupini]|uniref:Uncharacterized protein n=1 Tax=Colletotrichum lupini TaxID=145971 RepID=A0A9Q8SIV3_9PEZI|nr:uncharacterized protein CLUP02_03668 [Colletotrichum lupini]UQC78192.1 hypothetical protein CLUP02_03668 [Colletotrichum lupini]